MNRVEADALAARLATHPDYRVLKRLDVNGHHPALTGSTVRSAAIVDTETTGTDASVDKVIELAVVVFEYCRDAGTVGRVLETYDALEYPGMPIPASSTAMRGGHDFSELLETLIGEENVTPRSVEREK